MSMTLIQGSYIIAGLAFILALAGLSKHESAKSGNTYGIIGMGIALVITVLGAVIGINAVNDASDRPGTGLPALGLILVAVLIGAAIGVWRAKKVEMTGMPELIAMLHSFVGLAAVLVGYNSYLSVAGPDDKVHLAEVFIGVFIGAVTFTGSIIAFLKLSARMKSAPLMLPGSQLHQPRCRRRVPRPHRVVRALAGSVAAHPHDGHRPGTRPARSSPPSAAVTCRWSCRC